MITPHKKPPNGEPGEEVKEANRSVKRIRQVVEQTVVHVKARPLPRTDYHRPVHIRADNHRRTRILCLQNHS